MKAILYTRVSTQQQVDQGHSLAAQESRLRQYASFKGFADVELISDEGLSGCRADRPGFQRVLEAVRSRSVDAVVVYSLSRFARNTVATLDAIELMNRKGVAFHSLTEQIDTGSAVGRFFVTTLAALAQLEREQVGERTRAVLQHKKSNGQRVGQIPFGKRVLGDHLVPDETEQRVILTVKKLHATGLSYSGIAKELERQGMKNKGGEARWYKSQIHRLLTAA